MLGKAFAERARAVRDEADQLLTGCIFMDARDTLPLLLN
jgi:hypothetical protein